MRESAYFQKCYGVCPHPHPWRLYHRNLLLKLSQVFISSSPSITSYGFHSNPKQHNDFRALMLQPNRPAVYPRVLVPLSPGDLARHSAVPICCTQMGFLARETKAGGRGLPHILVVPWYALDRLWPGHIPLLRRSDVFPGPILYK